MSGVSLTQEQWDKILEFLRCQAGVYVGVEQKCRRFVEGVLWMLRSGAQWRLLPEGYGHWNSVFKRFDRWSEKGVWEAMHRCFADDPDLESVLIDSTLVRAHACAAGARKSEADQALGRSRGGFSTKIHVEVDALGNPLEFLLSAGQVSDVSQAPALLAGVSATYAILDKAYDADAVLELIEQQGMIAVIPPKANRTVQREYDRHVYKERHLVECFINKLKHYRHVFSRFDKTARNFMSFIRFAAALIWLR